MDSTFQSFEKRQKALRRKHKRMAQGYVNKLDRATGVIVQRPDNKLGSFLLRLFLLIGIAFMMCKVFLLAGLGEEAYLLHVDALASGSVTERSAALVLQIDPISAYLAPLLQPYLQ